MATPEFPFLNVDLKKLMGDFDVKKLLSDFKMPALDMESFMDLNRKNMEAVASINKVAAEGLQELAKSQAELIKDSMGEFAAAIKDMTSASTPEARAARQAEMAKQALERTLANLRHIGEVAIRTNNEVFQTVNGRVMDSIKEIKDLGAKAVKKPGGKGA